ncbi:hypothetical protein FK535_08920 [Mycolicibacterium sp. 018/SC-01/001]|uniref:type VII secretion target n=1 Tax=Mycolicibacterium sp. 018/SC-01/001 TaxID=2592069 RepID=UPI00117EA329|nr:type VII secretion target [Mycolicibacterium sp. 018/SC-01/001]TRW85509.1 hypothetical protein FK535_08920 [Mycolicibacterium sp. 018/SC-01/001]
MLVDPDVLRAFAGQVVEASSTIKGADVGHAASTAADGLPGSTTQWAMRLVGAHMTTLADEIATNVTKMGVAVRGAADKFQVEDTALAGSFDKIF